MSKIVLAEALEMLREAEKTEKETDAAYEKIIKSGEKVKDFTAIREGLRTSYQQWIKALEVVNFIRRAAGEAERMTKLKKQLAKLNAESSGDNKEDSEKQQGEGGEETASSPEAAAVLDQMKEKHRINQKRGLAAVSDEIVRNGHPQEILSLCEDKMNNAFSHCEKIRAKESSLLLSVRDADSDKTDCSKSRPGYVVAQVLNYRSFTEPLQGNYTATIPVTDGSYQVLVRNVTDVLMAAPDVTAHVTASYGLGEKKDYRGPCPPGCAFLRSIGIVGSNGSLFVHINSDGMRESRVEVIVRRIIPASVAAFQNKNSNSPTKKQNSELSMQEGFHDQQQQPTAASAASAAAAGNNNNNNNNNNMTNEASQIAPPPQGLEGLLPVLPPVGLGAEQQQQQQPTIAANVAPPPSVSATSAASAAAGGYQQQQNTSSPQLPLGADPALLAELGISATGSPLNNDNNNTSSSPVQQETAQQVLQRIKNLMEIVKRFPDEVAIPLSSSSAAETQHLVSEEECENNKEVAERQNKAKQESENQLAALQKKRTSDERAFETLMMELPQPTDILDEVFAGGGEDVLDQIAENFGMEMEDFAEMEGAGMFGGDS